jgi:hypothetical protein
MEKSTELICAICRRGYSLHGLFHEASSYAAVIKGKGNCLAMQAMWKPGS